MKKIFSDGMRAAMHKLKLLFTDHFQLLFKSSADNHLRIQQCQADKSGKIVCSLSFNSYSDLKKYQKKFRTATVSLSSALAMVLIAAMVSPLVFNPSRSGAANYSWRQTDWQVGASADEASHPADSVNTWTKFESQNGIDFSAQGEIKLEEQGGNINQTKNGNEADGFIQDGAGFDSGKIVFDSNNGTGTTGSGIDDKLRLRQISQQYSLTQTTNAITMPVAPEALTGGFNNSGSIKSSTEVLPSGTGGEDANVRLTSSVSTPTQTFNYIGASSQDWSVPAGVSQVTIVCKGAGGAGGNHDGSNNNTNGSAGDSVTVTTSSVGTYTVHAARGGQISTSEIGGAGGFGRNNGQKGGDGGTDIDDAYAWGGGGGGGSSAVYLGATNLCEAKGGNGGKGSDEPYYGLIGGAGGSGGGTNSSGTVVAGGGGAGGAKGVSIGYGQVGGNGSVAISYDITTFASSGTYVSLVDAGQVSPVWNNFQFTKGSTAGGAGSIRVQVKSSDSDSLAPTFDAVGNCDVAVSADGQIPASDISTCAGTGRYLWYKATLSAEGDTTKSPLLDDFTASATIVNGYEGSGIYTSNVIDTGANTFSWGDISWNATLNGQSLVIKSRSCDDASCSGEDATKPFGADLNTDWDNTGDTCNTITSGSSLSSGNCVSDGERYIQYAARFVGDEVQTPLLEDVVLDFSFYPTTPKNLLSSVFDTNDKYASIGKISWNSDMLDQSALGTLKFQLRSASSQGELSSADWCGPQTCASAPGGEGSDYYIDQAGLDDAINALQSDHDNKYLQYAAFINSADGSQTPVLQDVTVSFSYNNPPTISNVSASQLSSGTDKGKVRVLYDITDTDADLSAYPVLFYQADNVTLFANIDLDDTDNVVIEYPNGAPVPSTGQVLIGSELISFSGTEFVSEENGMTRTKLLTVSRSVEFTGGGNYFTNADAHLAADKVYFKATNLVAGSDANKSVSIGSGKEIIWDAKGEPNVSLNGSAYPNMKVLVAANDNYTFDANRTGRSAEVSVAVDFEAPTIDEIKTSALDGDRYKATETVPVELVFSEEIDAATFSASATTNTGHTLTLSRNSAMTAIGTYTVGIDENTDRLTVSVDSGPVIQDLFGNSLTVLTAQDTNEFESIKTIVIDTVLPQVSDVSPSANSYLKADGEISFTLDEQLASGTITLTAEAGGAETAGTVHTYTLSEGQRTNTDPQSVALSSFSPALVDGTKYTLDFATEDLAGNLGDFTNITGIAFDTDAPSVTINSPVTNGFFNSITTASDFSYTIDNDPFNEKLESLQLTFTAGEVDQVCSFGPLSEWLDNGEHVSVHVPNNCGAINLVSGTAYNISVTAVDQAGNEYVSANQVTSATFDDTPPSLSHFYSTSPNSTVELPTGAGDINVTAVYDEPVSGSLQVKVGPMNANVLVNLSSEVAGLEIPGSFTIGAPKTGYDSTPDYIKVEEIITSTITDRAGNVRSQSNASVDSGDNLVTNGSTIVIDTSPPILELFTIEEGGSPVGGKSYKAGDTFTLVANYNKTIQANGEVKVMLNTGGAAHEVTLTNGGTPSKKLTALYTVVDNEDQADLKVEAVTFQNVLDGKGTVLDVTGNVQNGDYAAAAEDPVTNLSNFKIDTKAPTLTSIKVTYEGAEAGIVNEANPEITVVASDADPFGNLAGAKLHFSMNGGSSWCTPVDYKQVVNSNDASEFLITNTNCGGTSIVPDEKTITAKLEDAAGNMSATANDSVIYDSVAPALQSFSTTSPAGIYGPIAPTNTISIIATYHEALSSGTMNATLNNGESVTLSLDSVGGATLSGTYTVQSEDNDTQNLKVQSISSESVSDMSSPVNTRGDVNNPISSVPIGADNLADGIIIDTTAPASSIVFDRSKGSDNGQLKITATDTNSSAGLSFETGSSSDENTACDLSGTFAQTYTGGGSGQEVNFTDDYSAYKKVCVRFKDAAGNESATATAVAPETPQDISYTDITNLDIDPPFKGIFILWPKPVQDGSGDFANYELKSCSTVKENSDCSPTDALATVTDVNANYYLHQPLSESNKYCYRLRFKDSEGNYSKYSETSCQVPSEGTVLSETVVNIEDISIGAETNSGATVSFKTTDANPDHNSNPLPTAATVQVFSDEALTTQVGPDFTEGLGISHIVKMTGLSASTTYYLKITAIDSIGSTKEISYTDDSSLTFTTTGALSTITLISDDVTTNNKAVIEFRTDQDAKCFIEYKRPQDASLEGTTTVETEFRKSHTITVSSILFPDTTYNYGITCQGRGDEFVYLLNQDFKTSDKTLSQSDLEGTAGDATAPEISAVSISEITGEKAVITWNTNEKANSLVMYSLDGSDFNKIAGDSTVLTSVENYSTAHTVTINDLIPASRYVYSVISADTAGNISQSAQSTFTTREPSSLSSVKVLSKALNQATISWETGVETSSIVEYGLTTAYGETKESNTRTKTHELTISDLQSGQTYHFRVKGEDADGNLFASNDNTFEPKSPPRISDFRIDEITEHGAKITFTTNVPTDTLVEYTDPDDEENSGVQGKPDYATRHELVLRGLAAGTEFGLKLKVRDEDGNETEETFQNFKTSSDENAPKIEQVRTDSALAQNDKVQAIISWKTDENANTKLVYKEGKAGKETEVNVSDVMTTSHIAVITSFKPGTVYYFNAISVDASGNEAKSGDFALLTPKRKENIIQIIVNNFQDIFGWAQR